jgi:integral membrane protein (TIGR01906 family)
VVLKIGANAPILMSNKRCFIMKIKKLVVGILLALYMASLSVVIAGNFEINMYKSILSEMHLERYVNLERDTVEKEITHLIEYTLNAEIKELRLNYFELSSDSAYHFEEVKHIVNSINQIVIYATPFVLAIVVWIIARNRKGYLKYAMISSIVILLIIGVSFLFFEDWSFEFFHRLVFKNEYWIFDPRIDPIIYVLPQKFFINSLYLILSIYLGFNVIVFYIERKIIQRVKEKSVSL